MRTQERQRRYSRQRQAIIDFLAAARHHPSAEEILQAVRKKVPTIGLATVYRNLDALLREGVISRNFHGDVARFDARTDPHHHFICTHCGRIENLTPLPHEKQWLARIRRKSGAKIEHYAVELHGLCRDCRTGHES